MQLQRLVPLPVCHLCMGAALDHAQVHTLPLLSPTQFVPGMGSNPLLRGSHSRAGTCAAQSLGCPQKRSGASFSKAETAACWRLSKPNVAIACGQFELVLQARLQAVPSLSAERMISFLLQDGAAAAQQQLADAQARLQDAERAAEDAARRLAAAEAQAADGAAAIASLQQEAAAAQVHTRAHVALLLAIDVHYKCRVCVRCVTT